MHNAFSLFFDALRFPSPLGALAVFSLGAIIGSFLNVCISRWPKGESVITPRSRCVPCGAHIYWYDNLPLLSYLLLRGRCRACQEPFSRRYFWVEFFTGGLFILFWAVLPWPVAAVGMVFVSLLMAGSIVDFETFTLPEPLLILGVILGLVCSYCVPELHGASTPWGGLGAAFAALCLSTGGLLWFSTALEGILRKPAMGLGDAYWIGVIAAFTGPWGALFALFVGSVFGCLFIGVALIIEKIFNIPLGPRLPASAFLQEGPLLESAEPLPLACGVAVPFGPWLSLAGAVYFLFFQAACPQFIKQLQQGLSLLLQ